MSKLYIPVILGTGRKGRYSEKVARFILQEALEYGFESEIVDVLDFVREVTMPAWVKKDEKGKKWSEIVKRADGLIIVAPEYNHGYSGELKIMLDELYEEYKRKPVALCGVSNGRLGGARAIENLKPVLIELRMVVVPYALYFANVADLFNEDENIKEEKYKESAKTFLGSLKWYAETLKAGREKDE